MVSAVYFSLIPPFGFLLLLSCPYQNRTWDYMLCKWINNQLYFSLGSEQQYLIYVVVVSSLKETVLSSFPDRMLTVWTYHIARFKTLQVLFCYWQILLLKTLLIRKPGISDVKMMFKWCKDQNVPENWYNFFSPKPHVTNSPNCSNGWHINTHPIPHR